MQKMSRVILITLVGPVQFMSLIFEPFADGDILKDKKVVYFLLPLQTHVACLELAHFGRVSSGRRDVLEWEVKNTQFYDNTIMSSDLHRYRNFFS